MQLATNASRKQGFDTLGFYAKADLDPDPAVFCKLISDTSLINSSFIQ